MAAFIFNFIFFVLGTSWSIITRVIFTATAYLLVLFIQAFKVPGESIKTGLEIVGEVIKSCIEYIFGLILEAISTIISTAIDQLIEVITGSAAGMASAISVIVERTREGLVTDLPEIAGAFTEMIVNMVADLWNNYKDALGYVSENA